LKKDYLRKQDSYYDLLDENYSLKRNLKGSTRISKKS